MLSVTSWLVTRCVVQSDELWLARGRCGLTTGQGSGMQQWNSERMENWQKGWWSNFSIKSGWTSATPLSGDSGISHQYPKRAGSEPENAWVSRLRVTHRLMQYVCAHVSSGDMKTTTGVEKGSLWNGQSFGRPTQSLKQRKFSKVLCSCLNDVSDFQTTYRRH